MKDAEISLAVARIIYPEYEWATPVHSKLGDAIRLSDNSGWVVMFNYKDKACAWDMMVWLAERVDGGTWLTLGELLQTKNSPYEEIAMSIIEVGRE